MIKINLLPVRAAQKKEKLREQIVVAVVILVVTLLGCAAAFTTIMTKTMQKQADIVKQEQEIANLEKIIGEVGRVKKLQEELQGKLDVLDRLKQNKSGPVHLLDELSKALPEKLWIESFKETSGKVDLNGIGLNEETVALFLKQLDESPYFRNVELQVIEQTSAQGIKLHKFTVVCQVEGSSAPAAKEPAKKS